MRVNSTDSLVSAIPPQRPAPSESSSASSAPAAAPAEAVSQYSQTSDLNRLMTLVKNAPEVRPDVVSDVSTKMAIGELMSSSAAADTANKIQQAQ